MDLERITNPLRLAKGSHQPGSGKGRATHVISNTNGHRGARRVGIVGMTVLAAVVVIVSAVVTRLERWLLRWKV